VSQSPQTAFFDGNPFHHSRATITFVAFGDSLKGEMSIARDIDQIIKQLETELPGVDVAQLHVSHPGADDHGLWFINIPGHAETVQVESSRGHCPFLIESDFTSERLHGHIVGEVVATVKRLFSY
jgi:hypothetical protein